jgi:hypothetical protein
MPGPINALNLFCLLPAGGFLCAAVGRLVGGCRTRHLYSPAGDWFSEQFSTAVLILPFILTLTPFGVQRFSLASAATGAGAGAVHYSWRGGGGAESITFPLPALIWCDSLSAAADLPADFLTGIGEILLVANSLVHLSPDAQCSRGSCSRPAWALRRC